MGSGGGGTTTSSAAPSPQVEQLQKLALPQIEQMLKNNPLSNYSAWSPRQIAGSNTAYDMLFGAANRMEPALNGLELLFGQGTPQQVTSSNPMTIPNPMTISNPTTIPMPPNFALGTPQVASQGGTPPTPRLQGDPSGLGWLNADDWGKYLETGQLPA